jgi:type I restriction enzyme, S subunit
MNKWPLKTLKSRIHVKHGYPFKSEYFSNKGSYIVLTPGNFYEDGGFKRQFGKEKFYSNEIPQDYLHKKGDLIVAMTEQAAGLLGSCAFVPESNLYLHNQRLGLITTKEDEVIKEFIYYLFKTKAVREKIRLTSSGSKVKHTSPDRIYAIQAHLPPIDEQVKIVQLLIAIDKKIELNSLIYSELEAMAKTLYDYWFVQFDFPDANGKPYKTSGGKLVYNPTLKREIPDGWEISTVADWIKQDKSGDWGKELPEGNYTLKVDCIRGTDINGINGNEALKPPTRYILDKNKFKLLSPFDIIVEISGGSPTQSTGRMAYLTMSALERFDNPITCSNFCKAITLKDTNYFFNFAYQWSAIYHHGILFGWEGKTSGIKNLLFEAFTSKYNITKPPSELAKSFFEKASKIEKQKQSLLKQNAELVKLRDWLLPMLMNGQVKVS